MPSQGNNITNEFEDFYEICRYMTGFLFPFHDISTSNADVSLEKVIKNSRFYR